MEQPVSNVQDMVDDQGFLTVDVACRKCGYNLRGLRWDSRCPECGIAVGRSTYGDLLQFSEPAWVDKLGRGVSLILWGYLLAILGGIAAVVAGAAMGNAGIQVIVGLAASLVGLYGAWLLTEPDPSGLGEDEYGKARRIVRFALIVGLAAQLLNAGTNPAVAGQSLAMLFAIVAGLAGLVGIVGEFAKLYYIEKLALRIPDAAISGRARFLRWAYTITLLVTVGLGAVVAVIAYSTVARPAAPGTVAGGAGAAGALMSAGCIIVLASLASLIFLLMMVRMLLNLGKRLREQAELARAAWAASDAATTT